jgi:3-oxoadipate enol-lactonase
MRVWEAGRGQPILLVHGLGGSGRYFERLAARLDGRFRVVAPDL